MWTQAVVAPAAAEELDRVGSIPIAAAIATETAARAKSLGCRRHDERGGNPNRIAFHRRPRRLLDEVFEGKRGRRLSPTLQPEILDLHVRDSHVFPSFWQERLDALDGFAASLAAPLGRSRSIKALVGQRQRLSQREAVEAMVELVRGARRGS
jgi:hypothetical protein